MESRAGTSQNHGGMSSNGNLAQSSETMYEVGRQQSVCPGGIDETVSREGDCKESLLPGIPDEVTLNHILTKLHWRNVHALASLCHSWRSVLRSREVLEARVRANSTQTLVAMIHDDPSLTFRNLQFAVSLYDCLGDTWHLLPQIPGIRSGIPEGCGCVAVHGKLYIMGGRGEAPIHFGREVYKFDPSGAGRWRQCASMICARASFACDVKDGKIYVFGGMGAEGAAEMYDPVQDVWRRIAPMVTNRIQHKVVHVGDEFYAHMGRYFGKDREWADATFAEVYDCKRDQWRTVADFTGNNPAPARMVEAVLVMCGRMFKILDNLLYLYDRSACSWNACKHVSWDVLRFRRGFVQQKKYIELAASVVAVKGGLLALVYDLGAPNEMVLTPLRGGTRCGQTLAWKKIQSSLHFRQCHCMCTIEV